MKTPEQWLEELKEPCKVYLTQETLRIIQAIQKDAVESTQADHNKALSQLRSFLHNQLHKVNFHK